MEVKDKQSGQGKIDVVVEIISVDEPRTFEKFGKSGKVSNAKAKDASGEITMSLWNEQCDLVKPGMKVHIINGWCSEFRGDKQLSTGKFGRLEIVTGDAAAPAEAAPEAPAESAPEAPTEPAPEEPKQ